MFWNKKKPKSKPQIKTTAPKTFKAKEPPPKWQPTFGETKKKDEKPPEVTTKSEPKIDWEDKFLKSFQKLTYRRRAWDVWRAYILLHACSISNVLDKDNYDQREKRYLKIIHQYSKEEQAIFPELAAYTTMALDQNQEQDFLGKMFMRLDLGNRSAGQFFTPYHVCELMAEVVATNALEKIEQDCRKLSITKKVLDCLYKFYHSENQSDETITTCMLLYGPKADLDGDGYEVEVEDGFVTKGV
jgi:hypothetical protein